MQQRPGSSNGRERGRKSGSFATGVPHDDSAANMQRPGGGSRHSSYGESRAHKVPAAEYFGSMAAGTIVGGSRQPRPAVRSGPTACSNASATTPRRTQRQQSGRRGNGGANGGGGASGGGGGHKAARPESFCRSQLVPPCETFASVPLTLLTSTWGERLDRTGGPCRQVWLALTANTLALYDGPGRALRLGVLPLRRVVDVGPSPTGFGVHVRYHSDLPAAVLPLPLPLSDEHLSATSLETAALFFGSAELQARWIGALRTGASPSGGLAPIPHAPPASPAALLAPVAAVVAGEPAVPMSLLAPAAAPTSPAAVLQTAFPGVLPGSAAVPPLTAAPAAVAASAVIPSLIPSLVPSALPLVPPPLLLSTPVAPPIPSGVRKPAVVPPPPPLSIVVPVDGIDGDRPDIEEDDEDNPVVAATASIAVELVKAVVTDLD